MNETFQRYAENYHEAVRQWKQQTGKKVFGYFCCAVPEEILFAADVLPVRIMGAVEPIEHASLHIPPNSCPFARSCLEAGMRGQYDYLDGVISPTSCDTISAMDYFWERYVPRPGTPDLVRGLDLRPYIYSIAYPEKVTGNEVHLYYLNVLREFKQRLERTLNRFISDDDLSRAVAVYNDQKAQMKRMYELRRRHPPAVSGYEAWQIAFAAGVMPKDQHAALLRDYLNEVQSRSQAGSDGVRIYLSAGPLDAVDGQVLRVIEEAGGQVVSDDTCFGTRSFWHSIDTTLPPLEAIARRSLATNCPRSTNDAWIPDMRWEYISQTAEGCDIQGAIFYSMKCCDAALAEYPHLADRIKEKWGVPVLHVEGDHTASGVEQMRSRIEAFIEMLQG
ncbi:MAG: 2-hydroxyacyl-CoA dehydratase family protein [Chloroflexi bacterium]|nr:2-hydroxyacyl-CoA dehydratase family protein [Chloroflexota bacterium]